MTPATEHEAGDMGWAQRIALRLAQAAFLAFSAYELGPVVKQHSGLIALAWATPWLVLIVVVLLLFPALCRLGWRRFGRPAPMWAVAAIVSTATWAIVTVLCRMALGVALLLSD